MSVPDLPLAAAEAAPIGLLIDLLKLGSFISAPMRDGVCDPAGMNPAELRVIMALMGEGALAGHDLVEITGLPAMQVSRTLAALRERGWIVDTADPDNRRRKPVALSEAGVAAYQRTQPHFAVVAEAVLGRLSPSQQRNLTKLTHAVLRELIGWIRSHHEEVRLAALAAEAENEPGTDPVSGDE